MGFRGKYKNRFIRVTVFIQKSGAYGISGTVTSCKRKCSEITEPSLWRRTVGISVTSSQKRHDPLMHGSLVCATDCGPFESLLGHLGCVGPSLADTPPTIHLPQLTIGAHFAQSKTQLLWEVYTSILWAKQHQS